MKKERKRKSSKVGTIQRIKTLMIWIKSDKRINYG